jgi:biopolymer transport protein ExbD
MRIKKPKSNIAEGDLTPMIDMTFQLIAFFMVLINFTEADQDERVKLPSSVLAKPPGAPLESPITIHLTRDGDAIFNGELVGFDEVRRFLVREREVLSLNEKTPDQATVIIRADAEAPTGKVQQLIEVCQQERFEKFALRAKEKVDY